MSRIDPLLTLKLQAKTESLPIQKASLRPPPSWSLYSSAHTVVDSEIVTESWVVSELETINDSASKDDTWIR